MRQKFLLLSMALVIASPAFADITLNFSTPVSVVSFYSAEPFNLTYSDNSGFTTTVLSGYTLGAVTPVGSSEVEGRHIEAHRLQRWEP